MRNLDGSPVNRSDRLGLDRFGPLTTSGTPDGPGWVEPSLAEASRTRERIDTRIILIDGTELARLMIAHGVGVTPVAVYELKRVDSDFFAED